MYLFSFLSFIDTFFVYMGPMIILTYIVLIFFIYIDVCSFTYLSICCLFSIFIHMLLISCMQSIISVSH